MANPIVRTFTYICTNHGCTIFDFIYVTPIYSDSSVGRFNDKLLLAAVRYAIDQSGEYIDGYRVFIQNGSIVINCQQHIDEDGPNNDALDYHFLVEDLEFRLPFYENMCWILNRKRAITHSNINMAMSYDHRDHTITILVRDFLHIRSIQCSHVVEAFKEVISDIDIIHVSSNIDEDGYTNQILVIQCSRRVDVRCFGNLTCVEVIDKIVENSISTEMLVANNDDANTEEDDMLNLLSNILYDGVDDENINGADDEDIDRANNNADVDRANNNADVDTILLPPTKRSRDGVDIDDALLMPPPTKQRGE
jgi:hypothetical protein